MFSFEILACVKLIQKVVVYTGNYVVWVYSLGFEAWGVDPYDVEDADRS